MISPVALIGAAGLLTVAAMLLFRPAGLAARRLAGLAQPTRRQQMPEPNSSATPSGTTLNDNSLDLALAADLVASALEAGTPLSTALTTAADALPTSVAGPIGVAGSALTLGARPEDVLIGDGREGADVLARFGRAFRRSGNSGARIAAQLRSLADDVRAEEAVAALDRARRVGVFAVLPLGLCSLPAFMLLGVVPLAAGLVQRLG